MPPRRPFSASIAPSATAANPATKVALSPSPGALGKTTATPTRAMPTGAAHAATTDGSPAGASATGSPPPPIQCTAAAASSRPGAEINPPAPQRVVEVAPSATSHHDSRAGLVRDPSNSPLLIEHLLRDCAGPTAAAFTEDKTQTINRGGNDTAAAVVVVDAHGIPLTGLRLEGSLLEADAALVASGRPTSICRVQPLIHQGGEATWALDQTLPGHLLSSKPAMTSIHGTYGNDETSGTRLLVVSAAGRPSAASTTPPPGQSQPAEIPTEEPPRSYFLLKMTWYLADTETTPTLLRIPNGRDGDFPPAEALGCHQSEPGPREARALTAMTQKAAAWQCYAYCLGRRRLDDSSPTTRKDEEQPQRQNEPLRRPVTGPITTGEVRAAAEGLVCAVPWSHPCITPFCASWRTARAHPNGKSTVIHESLTEFVCLCVPPSASPGAGAAHKLVLSGGVLSVSATQLIPQLQLQEPAGLHRVVKEILEHHGTSPVIGGESDSDWKQRMMNELTTWITNTYGGDHSEGSSSNVDENLRAVLVFADRLRRRMDVARPLLYQLLQALSFLHHSDEPEYIATAAAATTADTEGTEQRSGASSASNHPHPLVVPIPGPQILHRDVKPQNIVIDLRTGAAKLIDFGDAFVVPVALSGSDGLKFPPPSPPPRRANSGTFPPVIDAADMAALGTGGGSDIFDPSADQQNTPSWGQTGQQLQPETECGTKLFRPPEMAQLSFTADDVSERSSTWSRSVCSSEEPSEGSDGAEDPSATPVTVSSRASATQFYTTAVDVWSAGATLWCLILGCGTGEGVLPLPYDFSGGGLANGPAKATLRVFRFFVKILKGAQKVEGGAQHAKTLKEVVMDLCRAAKVIAQAVRLDPKKRPTAAGMAAMPFFECFSPEHLRSESESKDQMGNDNSGVSPWGLPCSQAPQTTLRRELRVIVDSQVR